MAAVDPTKRYQGRPCKYGHSGVRYVSGHNCVECVNQRAKRIRQMGKVTRLCIACDELYTGPFRVRCNCGGKLIDLAVGRAA